MSWERLLETENAGDERVDGTGCEYKTRMKGESLVWLV